MKSIVFPGQGSQYVGMGKDLFDSFPEVKVIFEEVNNALDQNLSSLIFNGPDDELTLTENAQPAIMTLGIAIIEILNSRGFTVNRIANISAGHSLGEYTSLTALNSLSLTNTAKFRFGYRFNINENGEGVWDNENLYLHDDSIPLNVPNLQYEKEYTFSTMILISTHSLN